MHRTPKTVPAQTKKVYKVTASIQCRHFQQTSQRTAVLDSFAGVFDLENAAIGRVRRAVQVVARANAAHLELQR